MPTLSDLKFDSLRNQGYTGTVNDMEWQWLADQTGRTDLSLNGQWYELLISQGYSGTINDMQVESWAALRGEDGQWNDLAYWFWGDGGGAYGPSVSIQRNNDPGYCEFEPPTTTECAASETYTANDLNFTNPANTWLWSIEPPVVGVTLSDATLKTCTVDTALADTDVQFNLKVVATDSVSTDTANRTTTFTQDHIDTNVAPEYIGPNINDRDYQDGVAITPVETFNLFTGTNLEFSLQPVGGWPTGLQIDSATGEITGTPSDTLQEYPGIFIRVTNSQGTADSSQFSITLVSGATAPIFDNGPVPDQNWPIDQAIAQFPLGQYFLTGSFPRTYTIESGSLPSGLTMNTAGQINGTPDTDDETGSFQVRCTNAGGFAVSNVWNWFTWEAVAFVGPIPAQTATVGTEYTHDYSQYFTGDVSDYVINTASWPPGTILDPNTGIVTFTPAATFSTTNALIIANSDYDPPFVLSNNFQWTVSEASTDPAFWALTPDETTYEMLGVKTGTGDLTTTHTADLYAPDFEGVYRQFGSNEPVWAGGYVLRNSCLSSNNGTGTGWATGGLPTVNTFDQIGLTGEPNTATLATDNSSSQRLVLLQNLSDSGNNNNTCIVYIKKDTNQSRFPRIQFQNASSGATARMIWQLDTQTGASAIEFNEGGGLQEVVDDGDWWKCISQYTNDGSTVCEIQTYPCQAATLGGPADNTLTGSIIVGNVELHLNKTIAEVKAPTDGWIFTTTAPLSKVWAIDETGAPLAEVPYLQYYPAAENKALYSNNLTEAGWSDVANVVTTYDQIGMTGEPNTASLVTDNSAADTSYVSYTTLPLTGSTRQLTNVFYVKKDTDETVFPWFYQTTGLGGNLGVLLNKNTGATSITTDTTTNPSAEAVDAGDWWKLMLSQEISGSGNIGYRVYPARTDIWGSGTADPALTAAVTIGNVEVYDGKTIAEVRGLGPIFTTTAAVATDATVYRFDTSNYGGDDVAWFTELNWPNASEGYTRLSLPGATGNAVILGNTSANNSRIFGYKKFAYIVGSETTPNCQISDGTTQLEKSKWGLVNSVTDGEATMETDLLSGGLQVSPSVVCTVTAPSDKLILAPIAGWEDGSCSIRNIQRYDITSYAEGKDIIDGLMA